MLAGKALAALDATGLRTLVVAGGVGANRALRARLVRESMRGAARVFFPDLAFCTDNGAMIALVGALAPRGTLASGSYAFSVRPRWDLATLAAP